MDHHRNMPIIDKGGMKAPETDPGITQFSRLPFTDPLKLNRTVIFLYEIYGILGLLNRDSTQRFKQTWLVYLKLF